MLKGIQAQAQDRQRKRQLQRSGAMLVTILSDGGWTPLAAQLSIEPTSVISRRFVASYTGHRLEPSGCARVFNIVIKLLNLFNADITSSLLSLLG